MPSYELIAEDKGGHRLFKGEDRRLYVADRSGADPDRTDDGPLRLDFPEDGEVEITAFGDALGVRWPVRALRSGAYSTVVLSMNCAVEAAKRLDLKLTVHGYPLDITTSKAEPAKEHVPDVDLDKRSFRAASTPLVHVPGMVRNILTYRAMRLSRESRWKGDAIFFLSALFPTIPAVVLLDLVEDRRKWAVENDLNVVIDPVTTTDTDTSTT